MNIIKKWHGSFDVVTDAVSLHDNNFNILKVNKSFGQTFNITPSEAVGRKCYELIHKADDVFHQCPIAEVLLSGNAVTKEFFEPYPGSYFEVTVYPLFDDKNNIEGILHFIKNITERKLIEKALRESEARYRTFFDLAAAGMGEADPSTGRFIRANDRLCEITGYSREEILYETVRNITHPDDLKDDWEKFQNMIRGEIPEYSNEKRYIRKDGKVIWVHVTARVIRDSFGKPVRTVGIVIDITKRKLAEEELRISEKTIRDITSSLAEGIYVLNPHGNSLFMNPEAERLLGWTNAELMNKNVHEVIHCQRADNSLLTAEECGILNVIKTGVQFASNDEVFIRRDGTTFPISVISSPIMRDGKIVAVVAAFRDMTETKMLAEALSASEKRYHILFDQSPDGIVLIDKTGKVIEFNEAAPRQLGYSREEFARLSLQDIDPTQSIEAIHSRIKRILNVGKAGFAVIHRTKQGELRAVHVTAKAIFLSGIPVVHAIWHDITESKQTEEKLRRSEEKFRTLFESASDAMYILDLRGNFLDINTAAYECLGYAKEEMMSMNLIELVSPQFAGRVRERIGHVARDSHGKFESAYMKKDGTLLPVEVNARTIEFEKGKAIFSIIRDITERKGMEETLKRSHEELELRVAERTSELTRSGEQLRNLASHLHSVREEERINIARDIHDDLGQMLLALNMDLRWFRDKYGDHGPIFGKVESMLNTLNATIKSVKRICTELRPSLLDDFGLVTAMQWQAIEFQKRWRIKCNVEVVPLDDIELEKGKRTALFRIFQEALTNVLKHAEADEVTAKLTQDDYNVTMEIVDNGKGITDTELLKPQSFGLLGMRERVFPWGGNIEITGGKSRGTKLRVTIPSPKNRPANS